MLRKISIRNFQSLKEVDLELGQLTVLVGRSHSGKSAAWRALRTLVSNVRGPEPYITHGNTSFTITATTDMHEVTLERGKKHGKYNIVNKDTEEEQDPFTTLDGTVPQQVSTALGIPPVAGSSLNFAKQFDKPFLVDESGGQVARTLGKLTGVSTIFEAVREANRRRLGVSGELKTRKADLASVQERQAAFHDLPKQMAACAEAEVALERMCAVQAALKAISALIQEIESAESALARVDELPVVPDMSTVFVLQERLLSYQQAFTHWLRCEQKVEETIEIAKAAAAAEEKAEADFHKALVAGGECPLCGLKVTS